ncbi:MAG: T9SS type A sorting domain-containing protein, partial [Bacteroidales bacterium]|nr:T9SS type A sorting domain-containing protein [Bacteroidales bacterium]
ADVALSMYPNPATDYVMVSSNYVINEIAVINALGQTVATYSGNAENVQINTQDLAKGVYMISIKTAEGSAVKKLTVVK